MEINLNFVLGAALPLLGFAAYQIYASQKRIERKVEVLGGLNIFASVLAGVCTVARSDAVEEGVHSLQSAIHSMQTTVIKWATENLQLRPSPAPAFNFGPAGAAAGGGS